MAAPTLGAMRDNALEPFVGALAAPAQCSHMMHLRGNCELPQIKPWTGPVASPVETGDDTPGHQFPLDH